MSCFLSSSSLRLLAPSLKLPPLTPLLLPLPPPPPAPLAPPWRCRSLLACGLLLPVSGRDIRRFSTSTVSIVMVVVVLAVVLEEDGEEEEAGEAEEAAAVVRVVREAT